MLWCVYKKNGDLYSYLSLSSEKKISKKRFLKTCSYKWRFAKTLGYELVKVQVNFKMIKK